MTPRHHLTDAILVEYATGAASEGVGLLVAVHCTLCPLCRGRVELLEEVGGELLDELGAEPISREAEARLLEALDDGTMEVDPEPRHPSDGVFPRPLLDLVGPADQVPWRFQVPGIRKLELPTTHMDHPVQLFQLSAGLRIPTHRHTGTERTLVLTGGFTDDSGSYARGDVAIHGEDWDHNQVIDPGEPCIALVVNDGPLLPQTLLGRVVQGIVGA